MSDWPLDDTSDPYGVFEGCWRAQEACDHGASSQRNACDCGLCTAARQERENIKARLIDRHGQRHEEDFSQPAVDYAPYLQSDQWKLISAAAKWAAYGRCQICDSTEHLNTHHRSYENLGHETPADVTVLCRDCHKLFHANLRLVK